MTFSQLKNVMPWTSLHSAKTLIDVLDLYVLDLYVLDLYVLDLYVLDLYVLDRWFPNLL
jgi:hypothetical protein